MSLLQIVYSSMNRISGAPEQVDTEIASILNRSRENNQRANVTGALLFNGQGFAQVLEGPAEAVEQIYERIQCDARHSGVVLLSNTVTADRVFSDWSMAYADPAAVSEHIHEPIDLEEICANPEQGGARIVQALHQIISA